MPHVSVHEPFPISLIAGQYLLFDVDTIIYARQVHHILGVLIGNIPQASQQTIFNGIPLQLTPEEARLLVSRGHAFIVDDVKAHQVIADLSYEKRQEYLQELNQRGLLAARAAKDIVDLKKATALSKNRNNVNSQSLVRPEHSAVRALVPFLLTPTTSSPTIFHLERARLYSYVPKATSSYALYQYLHDKGYFMTPGLRFGCQYTAYPGDPLRYHSHFLVVAKQWDEPIDLLDIVSGGRLGTGVKKGYLLGGQEKDESIPQDSASIRAFSVEWAAM